MATGWRKRSRPRSRLNLACFGPRLFGSRTLQANPILLAERAYPITRDADGRGIGPVTMKVTPKADSQYLTSQFLIPYLELYNAAMYPGMLSRSDPPRA